jgi:hypothetical protein
MISSQTQNRLNVFLGVPMTKAGGLNYWDFLWQNLLCKMDGNYSTA